MRLLAAGRATNVAPDLSEVLQKRLWLLAARCRLHFSAARAAVAPANSANLIVVLVWFARMFRFWMSASTAVKWELSNVHEQKYIAKFACASNHIILFFRIICIEFPQNGTFYGGGAWEWRRKERQVTFGGVSLGREAILHYRLERSRL